MKFTQRFHTAFDPDQVKMISGSFAISMYRNQGYFDPRGYEKELAILRQIWVIQENLSPYLFVY